LAPGALDNSGFLPRGFYRDPHVTQKLEVIDAFVVVRGLQIHKVKRQWGLAQAVVNVKHIAGCMSQSLKLVFDDVRVDRLMKVAQDRSVRSFPPRLVGMVNNVVGPKLCDKAVVGVGSVNIDINCII
jgi:hypothetical protein